ncbi:hypothetical protein AWB76_02830 [Caballeronia temeraria]|uniref:Uncharacterized protein n=1 Tax=Caballeronia temeraria TaxID=1777137 RepID=A0A158AQP3_9BURK|nr:hypothetical protein AWB76_02830 [Caballeronia temeraria]
MPTAATRSRTLDPMSAPESPRASCGAHSDAAFEMNAIVLDVKIVGAGK